MFSCQLVQAIAHPVYVHGFESGWLEICKIILDIPGLCSVYDILRLFQTNGFEIIVFPLFCCFRRPLAANDNRTLTLGIEPKIHNLVKSPSHIDVIWN